MARWLLIFTIFLVASPSFARTPRYYVGQVIDYPLSRLRATQEELGVDYAETLGNELFEEWSGGKQKQSYQQFLVSQFQQDIKPAIVGPGHHIYIIDGHHRTWSTITQLMRQGRRFFRRAMGRVQIVGIYSHLSKKEFVKNILLKKYNCYFRPETLRAFAKDPAGLLEKLKDFTKLVNSPWRSAVGLAFRRLKLKAKLMAPYIQFAVRDILQAAGVRLLPNKSPIAPSNIEHMADEILKNERALDHMRDTAPKKANKILVGIQIERAIDTRAKTLPKKKAKKIRAHSHKKFRAAYEALPSSCL